MHCGYKHLPSFPLHITKWRANLLGLDLFTGLWLMLRLALSDGLGCLTAFTHRPLVNPEVTPAIRPLCRIPLALRDNITRGLNILLDKGIIEPVNTSTGFPTRVTCLCGFKQVNKASQTNIPCISLRSSQPTSMSPQSSQSWI